MMWKVIAAPLIGAIIGYITNWVAVKMLFRPHYEKFICGIKVPFTPGVIPKGRKRLARAVGRAVEEQLLTEEVMKGVLLSDTTKKKLESAVDDFMQKQKDSSDSIEERALSHVSQDSYDTFNDRMLDTITDYAFDEVLDMDPGEMLSKKLIDIVSVKLQDSFLGLMLGGSFMNSIGETVKNGINEYMMKEGHDLIEGIVKKQMDKIEGMPVNRVVALVDENQIDVKKLVIQVYEYLVCQKLADILKALNISGIVEDRINAMDIEEVEELLLSIMKKELGAIVNLGALIGFVLGLVNSVIYLM